MANVKGDPGKHTNGINGTGRIVAVSFDGLSSVIDKSARRLNRAGDVNFARTV